MTDPSRSRGSFHDVTSHRPTCSSTTASRPQLITPGSPAFLASMPALTQSRSTAVVAFGHALIEDLHRHGEPGVDDSSPGAGCSLVRGAHGDGPIRIGGRGARFTPPLARTARAAAVHPTWRTSFTPLLAYVYADPVGSHLYQWHGQGRSRCCQRRRGLRDHRRRGVGRTVWVFSDMPWTPSALFRAPARTS